MVVRLDHCTCLQIWATVMDLGPFSNHAAEALRLLCCLNMVVSTPAVTMMLDIHRARVCEDTDLCGLCCEMNIFMASAWCSWAVLSKYAFSDRTGQIEGLSGNAKTFTQPLIVFCLECWKTWDQSNTQILILHLYENIQVKIQKYIVYYICPIYEVEQKNTTAAALPGSPMNTYYK